VSESGVRSFKGARVPSIAGGAALVLVAAWVLVSNWDPVVSGHPSYPILYAVLLALGLTVVVRGLRASEAARRTWPSYLAALGLLVLAFLGVWLSPFGADPVALAVLDDPGAVTIAETSTQIVLEPPGGASDLTVVFHPGARVDARAYLRVLHPIAEAGHQVVIVKEPLGIAFLSFGFTDDWRDDHPDVETWVVAGHSLGGVVASSDASEGGFDGLLLWASFPAGDISDVESLQVTSVYGTRDGFSEPARVEASAADLPSSAEFVVIDGAIHSYFGDYGLQPGDGEAAVEREVAQSEIVEASLTMLDRLIGRSG
jgi:hypothetical protein